jgi:hypothetical protein
MLIEGTAWICLSRRLHTKASFAAHFFTVSDKSKAFYEFLPGK